MKNSFEKSVNLGLGAILYSREKVEELVEELVRKGEVSKQDAKQFAAEIVKKGETQRNKFKEIIRAEITEVLNQMNLATKEDFVTKDEIRQIVREETVQAINVQRNTVK